jgi:hypothetical protein
MQMIKIEWEAIFRSGALVTNDYAPLTRYLRDGTEELLLLKKLTIMGMVIDANQQCLTHELSNALGVGVGRLLTIVCPRAAIPRQGQIRSRIFIERHNT